MPQSLLTPMGLVAGIFFCPDGQDDNPMSHLHGEWITKTEKLGFRDAQVHPTGLIVCDQGDKNCKGLVDLTCNDGAFSANGYNVKPLSLFENFDVLANSDTNYLWNELMMDRFSSEYIARVRQSNISQLRDVIEDTKLKVQRTIIRKKQQICVGPLPKYGDKISWFGTIKRDLETESERMSREEKYQRKRHEDAPTTKGIELRECLCASGIPRQRIEEMVVVAENNGHLKNGEAGVMCTRYCKQKEKYGTEKFWVVYRELLKHVSDRPTPDQLQRTVMASLRAMDNLVDEPNPQISFSVRAKTNVPIHLNDSYQWYAKHDGDKSVLEKISTRIDPGTGNVNRPRRVPLENVDQQPVRIPVDTSSVIWSLVKHLDFEELQKAVIDVLTGDVCKKSQQEQEKIRELYHKAIRELTKKYKKNPASFTNEE